MGEGERTDVCRFWNLVVKLMGRIGAKPSSVSGTRVLWAMVEREGLKNASHVFVFSAPKTGLQWSKRHILSDHWRYPHIFNEFFLASNRNIRSPSLEPVALQLKCLGKTMSCSSSTTNEDHKMQQFKWESKETEFSSLFNCSEVCCLQWEPFSDVVYTYACTDRAHAVSDYIWKVRTYRVLIFCSGWCLCVHLDWFVWLLNALSVQVVSRESSRIGLNVFLEPKFPEMQWPSSPYNFYRSHDQDGLVMRQLWLRSLKHLWESDGIHLFMNTGMMDILWCVSHNMISFKCQMGIRYEWLKQLAVLGRWHSISERHDRLG